MSDMKKQNDHPEQPLSEILKVRRDKLQELCKEGRDPFRETRYDRTAWSKDIKENYADYENKTVRVAGRIMSKRIMGKAIFCHIKDNYGQIQLYVRKDSVTEQQFRDFKRFDIGDIIGAEGYVFQTKTGEITVHVGDLLLLSKSLRPLPEKYHGMTSTELKYRRRYVDLIMSDESRHVFEVRSKFIRYVRSYLDSHGYMEVETPVLNTISGGAAARPFITHHNTLDIDLYLRIATELNLKRLIVGGIERVYEIGRIFRNEGMDPKHNPEFTTVELYQAYGDLTTMMDLLEEMLSGAAKTILGTYDIEWLGEKVSLAPGWKRMTMAEAVKKYVGIDYLAIHDDETAVKAAMDAGVDMSKKPKTWGNAFYETFDQLVESKIVEPTFITSHPLVVSPLAKKDPKDPRLVQRYELFICRCEMANAFSELNDPLDQKERFLNEVALREGGDAEAGMMDTDFIEALEYGMPPTGGLGVGIDRCVMMLTNKDSIRDVILFPTMKPLEKDANSENPEAEAEPKKEEMNNYFFTPNNAIDFSKVEIEPLFKDYVDFETFSRSDFRAVKVKACEAVPKSRKLLKFTLDDGTGTDRVILSGIHAYYEPEELVGKTLIAIVNLPPRTMMGIDSCGMVISAIHRENGEERLNLLMVDNHIPAGAKLY